MTPRAENIDTILCHAVEIESSDDRQKYLDETCAGDVEIRQQIEQLIRNHFNAGSFLESSAVATAPTIDMPPLTETVGSIIGPYKLMEQIGEGGMGVVYVAQQKQPIRRKVALKIIKAGMDTKQVIARFEAERQALALMDHANIAKVFDAGTTEAGRPFFIMELVRGVPITEYCDEAGLDIRERLKLFIDVCRAVQHAHQRGVIHRDLKPTNIMVTLTDGRAVPKVIDFGIAKAINQELTEHTLYTAHTQMLGTPMYMSPEQANMSSVDVDTRTDVYSLGVLLYELLSGATPFDKELLKQAGHLEMCRIIQEDEPPKPSTRVSTLHAEAITTLTGNRKSNPQTLIRTIRGELDWLVMKALDKDRNRRYESASAFAADVERFLDNEPIEAGPVSAWYRMRKFASKHRGRLVAVSLVAISLIVAVIVSTSMAIRATNAGIVSTSMAIRAKNAEQRMAVRLTELEQYNEVLTNLRSWTVLDEDLVILRQFFEGGKLSLRGHRAVTDRGLAYLKGIRNLTTLDLKGTNVSDEGLKHVAKLEDLRALDLNFTFVTDTGLVHLTALENLQSLSLLGNQIDGSAFSRLGNLTQLSYLDLNETFITDENLPFLQKFTALRKLELYGCPLSEKAVATLRDNLPNCEIIWDSESVRSVPQVSDANGAGQQVDLIEQLTNSGPAKRLKRVIDGKLLLRLSTNDGVQVPHIPPPEYDLRLCVVRRGIKKRMKHNGFHLRFLWNVDGRVQPLRITFDGVDDNSNAHTGFAGIDNSYYWLSVTEFSGRLLPMDKEIVVVLKVRRDALGLEVDGRPVSGWTGNPDEMIDTLMGGPFRHRWEKGMDPAAIAFGSSSQAEFDVTELKLIPHVRKAELKTEERGQEPEIRSQ